MASIIALLYLHFTSNVLSLLKNMNLSKQKIRKIIEIILVILLVLYFFKTLWVNIMSYDKVYRIPRTDIETEEIINKNNQYEKSN